MLNSLILYKVPSAIIKRICETRFLIYVVIIIAK